MEHYEIRRCPKCDADTEHVVETHDPFGQRLPSERAKCCNDFGTCPHCGAVMHPEASIVMDGTRIVCLDCDERLYTQDGWLK